MARMTIKRFQSPDESRAFPKHGRMDLLNFGKTPIGRGVFEPGWKWSVDLGPTAGTPSCEVAHLVYVISGRMHVAMDDGESFELGPGDTAEIPPGHDAWVVGSEPCVSLDFGGLKGYAQARPASAAGAPTGRPSQTH